MSRTAEITRETTETRIHVQVDLDGTGSAEIATGVGFLDHMLTLFARHSLVDLVVAARGDLHIDDHHTTEDVAITMGQAFRQALGDKRGIRRYGECALPMDETLTRVALDVSGRAMLVFRTEFGAAKVGTFDTELVREWFQGFAANANLTLHVETPWGANNHHVAESCFKGLARALRMAIEVDPRAAELIPSTKGTLSV